MTLEPELHYFHKPHEPQTGLKLGEFLPVQDFLADEPACKELWALLTNQFRTRGKFLAIWPGVRYVAVHRDADGNADGFLLVTAPVNWQIDYVVVKPESRGQGIATQLVQTALHHAYLHRAPYVMLTSKESLRPLYLACGFIVVQDAATADAALPAKG
ncbi:GNAT family N-acetyltransferase [Limnoglobus roseus]|uniref:N-acetyltransferase n=1 Tax=Limnoglobus roseus TaxID=2598579 RepID=A0A5C1ALV7_9BACT|nr:GNAT family N-acetyltransferase [Limnoglobus roseus]QEL20201.1 N-acetyltransferase [Limnoglobus roseus]